MHLLVLIIQTHATCMLTPTARASRVKVLLYVHIMKNGAFSRGTQCRPHEAMFDLPIEVGLKTSCLPYGNILNLLREELAAISASVE